MPRKGTEAYMVEKYIHGELTPVRLPREAVIVARYADHADRV